MSKRRNGLDQAIERVQDNIRVQQAALVILLQQRGDDVHPPFPQNREVREGALRRRPRSATVALGPDGSKLLP
jgi:hypothetical protein